MQPSTRLTARANTTDELVDRPESIEKRSDLVDAGLGIRDALDLGIVALHVQRAPAAVDPHPMHDGTVWVRGDRARPTRADPAFEPRPSRAITGEAQ
ncbi:hypothetical protein A2J03_26335 [Rhodococcus sp. EPR-157]|nr:hypothetical protein A2J03_26335 [Rhodococcus sp. EPR-157]